MSSDEQLDDHTAKKRGFNKGWIILAVIIVALIGTAAVYASVLQNKLPQRNTPATKQYTLGASPTYYADVARVKSNSTDTETIQKLDSLLSQPVAKWLIDDSAATMNGLTSLLEKGTSEGTVPLFVIYNIPHRDLGSYSSGGAKDGASYEAWIRTVSEAIGTQASVVILEPDALAQTPDMSKPEADERIQLLAHALTTLQKNTNTAVYLDGGNSRWIPTREAALLLKRVSEKTTAPLTGIALNVSNFLSEQETRVYAEAIQQAFGQKLYVMIDNSRNGAPEATNGKGWCNPEGQRLGSADHTFTATNAVEVSFIKTPGQSDGECGISTKPAGVFDEQLLLHQIGT